jgi:hypothetical protein
MNSHCNHCGRAVLPAEGTEEEVAAIDRIDARLAKNGRALWPEDIRRVLAALRETEHE